MSLNDKLAKEHSLWVRPSIVLFAAFCTITIIGTECWSKGTIDLFSKVPQQSRERFVKRLNMLIQYQRAQRWEKMYTLLYSGIKREETIERFATRHQHWFKEVPEDQVLGFVPHSLRPPDNAVTGEWVVFGCITVTVKGNTKKYEGMVSAYYEEDDWFFSEPGIITAIDGPPTECENLSKKKASGRGQAP